MPAPQELLRLIERFDQHHDDYRRGRFNETQLRRDFLDPFFEILGWDVENKKGYAEAYREVIHEDAIRIDNTIKAPDYTFRIGGDRKFFVEAKKPGVNIKDDIAPAYQVRRYAWSAKLPLSLLTDFEEWAVYDTRIKPDRLDRSTVARIQYFNYSELPERWDEFEGVFSREAILRGSFDKYAQSAKSKRGTTEVDDAFLAEIDDWRDMLAQNLALRNPHLSQRDLNFAVQRTIDRIIFLRICEDRGIEEYGRLRDLKEGKGAYERLVQLYHQADARYNSGLFHFRKERGEAESPDIITPDLKIDDRVLHEIARRLYYPDSPYEFSVFSSSILGHVYERFLGKVIVLDTKHKATVEEKPEVRKAGGVFYTPDYISKYIVENTVGKLVEDKEPKDVAEVRVLDPACGSGSFLLAAYDFLLDWHLRYYLDNDPESIGRKKNAPIFRVVGADGSESWRLATSEKRRILLNNIYGVDIDQQAVEVTKLSLLLKVLEGESEQTLGSQMALLHQRVLPDLGNNIKNGNSLVGPDFYGLRVNKEFVAEDRARINAFDWNREFSQIMREGGFHVIVGNPPYVRQEGLAEIKKYLGERFESSESTADLYVYFIEQGIRLLRPDGRFGIIVSNSFLRASYGLRLRQFLRVSSSVDTIVDFGGLAVFRDAKDTYVCIPLLRKASQNSPVRIVRVLALPPEHGDGIGVTEEYSMSADRLRSDGWVLASDEDADLFGRIAADSEPLGSAIADRMYYGIKTGYNAAFEIGEDVRSRILKASPASSLLIKRFAGGQEIRRYQVRRNDRFLIVVPSGWTKGALGTLEHHNRAIGEQSAWEWFRQAHPQVAEHLRVYEQQLRSRSDQGDYWWELRPCDYYFVFEKPKIIFPDIAKEPRFVLDESGLYLSNTAYCIDSEDLFLLGFLNSRLFWYCVKHVSIPFGVRAGEYRYRLIYQYMARIPVPRRDVASSDQIAEQIVDHVRRIRQLLDGENQGHVGERELAFHSEQVDHLFYRHYGLSEADIAIIERGSH